MYLSPDDARSDFFLAAALYVIGPSLFALLARAVPGPFGTTPGLLFLAIGVPLLVNAAMPIFLLRHREGSLAPLRTGGVTGLLTGLAVGSLLIGGVVLGALASGVGSIGVGLNWLLLLEAATRWGTLAILAVFLVIRAEYAFRPISEEQAILVRKAGVLAVGTVGVTAVLLLLDNRAFPSLLPAIGAVAVFFLAERLLPQEGMGERWWVWAPAIALALGPVRIFTLFRGATTFLGSAQRGAIAAIFGLVVVMALHRRRGASFAFGLSLAFAIASVLAITAGTRVLI